MEEVYIQFMQHLGEAAHLPVHLFVNDVYCQSSLHPDSTPSDSPFSHNARLFKDLCSHSPRNALINDKDIKTLFYGLVRLSDGISFVVGPYSVFYIDESVRYDYMTRHRMTDYQNYWIPVITHERVRSTLKLILLFFGAQKDEIAEEISTEPVNAAVVDDTSLFRKTLMDSEEGIQHHSYRLEKELIDTIKSGNDEALIHVLSKGGTVHAGKVSRHAKKQSEYLSVIGVSLMARAAMDVHVDPYRAYSINDFYLQQLSEAHTPEQHQQILIAAAHQLTEEIRNVRQKRRSLPHVERAKQYIDANLNREITMQELSKIVAISPNHLSAVFKKQEGITISAYVVKKRIEAAKIILCHSDKTITQIAAYLCFSSPSHLAAAFRTQTGMAPSEFRNRNQILP